MSWFENLKKIKAESGMSIHEIAIKSGLPEPTLEKIFSGATKSPGIYTVQTVVHALGYTLNAIDPGAKKSPDAAEATPGEDRISMEESNRLLVALGLIDEGQDLSDDDLAFLEHIIGLLNTWFNKRG